LNYKDEDIAQSVAQKAVQQKNKLESTKSHHKNITLLEEVIDLINLRETNMIQRAQYNTYHQTLRLFPSA
jgi:hypothetical protein